jgi:signal transduction histidine kinase
MITSLLDVHKLESGEMPLSLGQVDLREVAHSAMAPLRAVIGARSLEGDIPEEPVEAWCDAGLIRRVLTNLLGNAVKFTPEVGAIRVVLEPLAGGGAKVSVVDTGCGIPAEYHERIFEKFGQIGGHQHRHSTGLGLTFCKLAIEAQGGRIGVESVAGHGTTMWFVIGCPAPETGGRPDRPAGLF